jgi:hypothetical protein
MVEKERPGRPREQSPAKPGKTEPLTMPQRTSPSPNPPSRLQNVHVFVDISNIVYGGQRHTVQYVLTVVCFLPVISLSAVSYFVE